MATFHPGDKTGKGTTHTDMVKTITVALLMYLIAPEVVHAQTGEHPGRASILAELERKLEENAKKESVGSITAAVIAGEQVIWTKQFGWVDREKKVPPSPETLYLIGSISKSVTGVALARLVEKGVLHLDDPVEKYVPEIKGLKNQLPGSPPITFRHLATHTAGLDNEPEMPEAAKGPFEAWESKVVAAIPATSCRKRPGEQYSYSNIGYGILGLAMSRATRQPFDQLLQKTVFVPLAMKNSGLVLSAEGVKNLAVSYANTRPYGQGRGYKYPNGGVYATLGDLVNFAKAQMHTGFAGFLAGATWEKVQDFQATTNESDDEKYGYGLGMSVWTDKKGRKWVYHNGIVAPGYSASLYCDLSAKMGIVILRNDSGSDDVAGIADEFLYKLTEAKNKK